jgi:release factor glutamine methyltransferase
MPAPSLDEIVRMLRAAGCVFAEIEARLLVDAFGVNALETAVAQRVDGMPLEQLLGWAEFAGLRVSVAPGVFVPRRRTELLVHAAVDAEPSVVLDICCGSGAVAAAIAHERPGVALYASDIAPAAVRCARRNLEPVGGHVYEGDMYSALPPHLRGTVDVVVANAPYVPTDAIGSMPSEARDHEPRNALDGGIDGLDLQRRVADGAREWLAPAGRIVVETSVRQAQDTAALVDAAGFDAEIVRSEELDGTAVVGRSRRG